MDYEKKYKEALELARVAAFNGHQSLMEGIFPELAESKDEKTRKRIIALVNAHGQGMYKDDMLAWLENIPYTIDHEKREGFHLGYKAGLEKQGEQNPQRMISAEAKEAMYNKPACVWSEEDEVYLNTTIAYLKDAKEFKKAAEDCINWLKSLKQRIGG